MVAETVSHSKENHLPKKIKKTLPVDKSYKGYQERRHPFIDKQLAENILNQHHEDSPFYGYVGNEDAVETFGDVLHAGFKSVSLVDPTMSNHCVGPAALAFIGPPSVGKTELAKRGAQAIGLPFIECDRGVKNTEDLFLAMEHGYKQWNIELIPSNPGHPVLKYLAPPAIIFFDEAQAIRGDWLLKATESNDATLITNKSIVDCRQILWIFCTTHRGKLSGAFDTRTQKLFLRPHTRTEVGEIVNWKFPDFPPEVCYRIAGYARSVPREAINFGTQVMRAADRHGTDDWEGLCKKIATRNGVDEEGFTNQHMQVLASLFNRMDTGGLSLKKLAVQLNVAEEDLEKFILPPLFIQTPDREPLITSNTQGYHILPPGVAVLRRKGLIRQRPK